MQVLILRSTLVESAELLSWRWRWPRPSVKHVLLKTVGGINTKVCGKVPIHHVPRHFFVFENFVFYLFSFSLKCGALGRAVEHSTLDHWVSGSKPGVFVSGTLSFFVSLPGAQSLIRPWLLRSDVK